MKQSISKYGMKIPKFNQRMDKVQVLAIVISEMYHSKCVLRFVSINCRLQLWGNTTLSVGLRRICWRSRGKEPEPTTRRRTSWGGRCLSWMLKVREDCAAIFHRLVCSWYEHVRRQLRAWIHLNPHRHVQIFRCGLPVEKVGVPAWISRRRMSLRSSHTASAPGPCGGQYL